LAIAANGSWLIVFNNLSSIPSWLSDGLCCVSTGGGFATRTLYEDDEETVLEATRPIIMNGVPDVAERSDLVDRSLFITPPQITGDRRRAEKEFYAQFQRDSPKILGFLCDCMSNALRLLPDVHLDTKPRMADFACFGEAVCRGAGMEPGTFMAAYEGNRSQANDAIIEDSDVANAVIYLMKTYRGPILNEWSGPPADLLEALTSTVGAAVAGKKTWPKKARAMSGDLKRVVPNLQLKGYQIDFSRGKRRRITITAPEMSPESPTPEAPSTPPLENQHESHVGGHSRTKLTDAQRGNGEFTEVVTLDGASVNVGRKKTPTPLLPYENRHSVGGVDGVGTSSVLSGEDDDESDWEEL
jgi:hypothetical protein